MSRRRKQLAAAASGALVLAVVLAAILASGGSSGNSHSTSVPTAQIPASSTDPHAQDCKQITALALAYQQALTQATGVDPCKYLDPQSRAWVDTIAKHRNATPESCAAGLREGDVNGDVAYGNNRPPGIDPSTIQFGLPSQQVRCDLYSPPVSLPASQHGLSWAIAGWAGAAGNQARALLASGLVPTLAAAQAFALRTHRRSAALTRAVRELRRVAESHDARQLLLLPYAATLTTRPVELHSKPLHRPLSSLSRFLQSP